MKHHADRIRYALISSLCVFSAPAIAMKQCPEEFGEKSPLVDITGWGIVALGFILGVILIGYIVVRSRGQRWPIRSLFILLGFIGMVALWLAGLVIATIGFFLAC